MRYLVPLCVFLSVAAFHSALCASLEHAEKEEKVAAYDGLTELQKIDQMEFEAAQKNEAAHLNVTEEQGATTRYLEAVQDGSVEERSDAEGGRTAEGGGRADSAAHDDSQCPESSEEADGRQRREHQETAVETVTSLEEVDRDSTKEEDVLE